MNLDKFDKQFDQAFDEAMADLSHEKEPDIKQSWNHMKQVIQRKKKRQVARRIVQNVLLVAASMLLGVMLFGGTQATVAFTPIYQSIKELPGRVSVFFGNVDNTGREAITSPPVNQQLVDNTHSNEKSIINVSFEELNNKISFTAPSFSYIPSGFELIRSQLFIEQGQDVSNHAIFTFRNAQEILRVTILLTQDDTVAGLNTDSSIEIVRLKYGNGFFIHNESGTSVISFGINEKYVTILGNIEKEEMIQFANNIY
jgi:hypothetical protein